MYERCLPCLALISACGFRCCICSSVKRYSVVCCCAVRVQCEYDLSALRCFGCAVRILPFLQCVCISFILAVGYRASCTNRFSSRWCVARICRRFSDRVDDLCRAVSLILRQFDECRLPGFTLVSACDCRYCLICSSVKRYRVLRF